MKKKKINKAADARRRELPDVEPIHKDDLVNKYVEILDGGGLRIVQVKKVIGMSIKYRRPGFKEMTTVKMENIICNVYRGHCRRPINWSIRRKKKRKESNVQCKATQENSTEILSTKP
jgi:hypothetical protein